MKQERKWETSARELQNLGCDVGVEHVHNVDGEVALQPADVADSPVHDLQDVWIGEDLV